MSPDLTPGARALPRDSEREAPSAVLSGCQPMVLRHRILGFTFLAAAGVTPWYLFEVAAGDRLMASASRQTGLWPPEWTEWFGIGCGVLAFLTAVTCFASSAALAAFMETRRIPELHHALRRVRMVWRVLGISILLTGGTLAAARWKVQKAIADEKARVEALQKAME